MTEPHGTQITWLESLEHNVCVRRQLSEQHPTVFGLQVQRDTTLGCIVVPEGQATISMWMIIEERPNGPRARTCWRLDLDHVGAQVSHQLAGELALFV